VRTIEAQDCSQYKPLSLKCMRPISKPEMSLVPWSRLCFMSWSKPPSSDVLSMDCSTDVGLITFTTDSAVIPLPSIISANAGLMRSQEINSCSPSARSFSRIVLSNRNIGASGIFDEENSAEDFGMLL